MGTPDLQLLDKVSGRASCSPLLIRPVHREVLGPGSAVRNQVARADLSLRDKIRAQQQRALTVAASGVAPLAGSSSRTLFAAPRSPIPPCNVAPIPPAASRNVAPVRVRVPPAAPRNTIGPASTRTSRSLFPYEEDMDTDDVGHTGSTSALNPNPAPHTSPPATPRSAAGSQAHVQTEAAVEEPEREVSPVGGTRGREPSPLTDCEHEETEEVPASPARGKGKGRTSATRGGKAGRGGKGKEPAGRGGKATRGRKK
jgi:hypothetical protein